MTADPPDAPRRPLVALLAHIQSCDRASDARGADDLSAQLRAAYPELPLVAEFKSRWIELSAGQQLVRAREQVPDNAGPLHSSRLVTQSLALMQSLSPAYLHTFMAYVDALCWAEQLMAEQGAQGETMRGTAARGATRASSRTRSRSSTATDAEPACTGDQPPGAAGGAAPRKRASTRPAVATTKKKAP